MERIATLSRVVAIAIVVAYLGAYAATGGKTADGGPWAPEFLPIHAAGQMAADGRAADAYDPAALSEQMATTADAPSLRWTYPPFALLVAMGVGALPFTLAYPAYAIAGLASSLVAGAALEGRRAAEVLLTIFPAFLVTLVVGQNAAFSFAALAGGSALFGSRPFVAGFVWSALTFKPQLALVLPLFLVYRRAWRALAGFTVGALSLALVGLAVGGFASWAAFIEAGRELGAVVETGGARLRIMAGVEPTLLNFGVPLPVARVGQVLSAVLGLGLGAVIWRRGGRLSLASIAPITLLVTPYAYFYDLSLLAVTAILMPGRWAMLATTAPLLAMVLGAIGYNAAPLLSIALLVALYRASERRASGSSTTHAVGSLGTPAGTPRDI